MSKKTPVYLTKRGEEILKDISIKLRGQVDVGVHEYLLTMLANQLDIYEKAAIWCRDNGTTQKTPKSDYRQISPEWSVMTKAYNDVLRHAKELGLFKEDSGDRDEEKPEGVTGILQGRT